MSEMIERLARAIEAESNYVISQHHAKALARAAIGAMREPTFNMERAGGQCLDNASTEDVRSSWQAMIDAALAPPEQPGGA